MGSAELIEQQVLPLDLEGRRQLLQIERRKVLRQIPSFDTCDESMLAAIARLGELTDQYHEIVEEMRRLGMDLPWLD